MRRIFCAKTDKQFAANKLWVALLLLLLCGILCGTIFFSVADSTEQSTTYYFMRQYLAHRLQGSFLQVFSFSFLSAFCLQACALLFGFCAFGSVLLLLLPLAKGITIGAVSAYLYIEYGWRGVLINAVMHWIPNVLQCVCLLLFIQVGMHSATAIFAAFVSKKEHRRTFLPGGV